MNLEYIHKNDLHEKYLQGQLSGDEIIAYESFLEESEQARQELQEIRVLIQGVRDAGSDSMRREIERQVEEIRSPKTDWSIIYKAAAILFVFVLVPPVVYFQLFDLPEEKQLAETITTTEIEESEPEEEIKNERLADLVKDDNVQPVLHKKETRKMRQPVEEKASAPPKGLDALETEATSKIAMVEDLDESLNMAGGASSGAASMRSSMPKLKQKALSSGIGKLSNIKSYRYRLPGKVFQMKLFSTDSINGFPNSYPVDIITQRENLFLMNWNVSQEIYSLKKENILLEWDNEKTLNINIMNKYSYEIKLDSAKTSAIRINKKD